LVAETNGRVLIRGESGTGKELVARAIHRSSPRSHMPLVVAHCGGLPDGLVESELFGHEKGAFTGAEYKRKGKFELADGGVIFFDEIGDITPKTQIDLLRVLEEKAFTRIGGNQVIRADFRVIAATNRDLAKEVEAGRFRLDLYYRINLFTIALPPLRERRADIPLLARHFLLKSTEAMGRPPCRFAPEALQALMSHDWPGNVRELENVIERAVIMQKGEEIRPGDLAIQSPGSVPPGSPLALSELEKAHIQAVLERFGGNITQAAQALEIDRVTLYNKIRKYGLKRQE
jgi:transcriptional regulator with GAF, ATPase, and Fis domain